MRINAHSHIFNAQSVFTRETLSILTQRIKEMDLPGFLEEKLFGLIRSVFDKVDDYTETDALVETFIKNAAISDRLEELSGGWKVKLDLQNTEVLEKAGVKTVLGILEKVFAGWSAAEDDARKKITGLISRKKWLRRFSLINWCFPIPERFWELGKQQALQN